MYNPYKYIEYFLIPLIDFPRAICISQVNCVICLCFHYVDGEILRTTVGGSKTSSRVNTLDSAPPNASHRIYLYRFLFLLLP